VVLKKSFTNKKSKMKKLILFCTVLTLGFQVMGQSGPRISNAQEEKVTWTVDKAHSKVGFTVTHLVISEVEGRFGVYEGEIQSEGTDFENAAISFAVDVQSIDTDNSMRDDHLKSDDFFNAESYPTMNFTSSSFTKVGDKKYELKGILTIRDVAREITFEVKHGGIAQDGYGNTKAGFKATGVINRFDYGLKWNAMTEAGGLVVENEVEIELNLQFAKN
jgi:polyisoprenoid-binding protein YceI